MPGACFVTRPTLDILSDAGIPVTVCIDGIYVRLRPPAQLTTVPIKVPVDIDFLEESHQWSDSGSAPSPAPWPSSRC